MMGALATVISKFRRPRAVDGAEGVLRLSVGSATDVGGRQINEDRVLADSGIGLSLVADGLGGHDAGEVASTIAVETIHRMLSQAGSPDFREAEKLIRAAVAEANHAVHGLNQANQATQRMSMGTTIVGAWRPDAHDRRLIVFNLGDTRAYLFRDGELSQLTRDHTLYQAWLDGGSRGPAPDRHYLVACIGVAAEVDPALTTIRIEPGDSLLLCTDGFYPHLTASRFEAAVAEGGSPDEICGNLVAEAIDEGEADNVSLALLRWSYDA